MKTAPNGAAFVIALAVGYFPLRRDKLVPETPKNSYLLFVLGRSLVLSFYSFLL